MPDSPGCPMSGSSWYPYNSGWNQLPRSHCLHDHGARPVSNPSTPVPPCPVLPTPLPQCFQGLPFPILSLPHVLYSRIPHSQFLLVSSAPRSPHFRCSRVPRARFSRFPELFIPRTCPLSPDESPSPRRCQVLPGSPLLLLSAPYRPSSPGKAKARRAEAEPSPPGRAGAAPGPGRDHHGFFHRQLLATEPAARRPQR